MKAMEPAPKTMKAMKTMLSKSAAPAMKETMAEEEKEEKMRGVVTLR